MNYSLNEIHWIHISSCKYLVYCTVNCKHLNWSSVTESLNMDINARCTIYSTTLKNIPAPSRTFLKQDPFMAYCKLKVLEEVSWMSQSAIHRKLLLSVVLCKNRTLCVRVFLCCEEPVTSPRARLLEYPNTLWQHAVAIAIRSPHGIKWWGNPVGLQRGVLSTKRKRKQDREGYSISIECHSFRRWAQTHT